jgi:hypothetical protein
LNIFHETWNERLCHWWTYGAIIPNFLPPLKQHGRTANSGVEAPLNLWIWKIVMVFLVNKTNRCSEFQFYWYYDSTCFGQPFCPSKGALSLNRLWYILCSCNDRFLPGAGCSILLLVANGSSQLHKMYQSRCTVKNSLWQAKRLPETRRVVIPIKLEFTASVGLIHKESVTMHVHTVVKFIMSIFLLKVDRHLRNLVWTVCGCSAFNISAF